MNERPSIDKNGFYCLTLHSLSHIENLAQNVLESLPKSLRNKSENLSIKVENFATQEVLEDLNIDNRYDLLGLYKGIPFEQQAFVKQENQNIIFLFRGPIIRYTQEFDELIDHVVKQVVLQEVGLHFNLHPNEMKFILHR